MALTVQGVDPSVERARGPVTLNDVARSAGVSTATVSRVVNGHPRVGVELAAHVREVASRLGYVPNPSARSLCLGVTRTISVVVPDLSDPRHAGVVDGLTRGAAVDGYAVLLQHAAAGATAATVQALRRRSDAVVVCSPAEDVASWRSVLETGPAVVVGRRVPGVASVDVDHAAAVLVLVEHFLAAGHRRLLYLDGAPGDPAAAERERGLHEALTRHPGARVDRRPCGGTVGAGCAAWPAVLAAGATAVIAGSDAVAAGLLARGAADDVPVGGDVGVGCLDDLSTGRTGLRVPTTAGVAPTELGRAAWRSSVAQLGGTAHQDTELVAPRLRVGSSTGAVAA